MATRADTFIDQSAPPVPAAGSSLLDELMTARQVADLLQVPTSTIEDYARRGVLPSLKLGRHRRFVRSEVEHTIAELLDRQSRQTARGRCRF
jgi:excisionase family DNA binding protein